MSQPDLSIIFPAYNEAENILESIQQALPFVDSHNAEIIIVDDGSQDNTAQLVANFAHVSVRLLQHETNRGYGAALRTGFLHARGTWVFFTDADLQFDLQPLLEMATATDSVASYCPWYRACLHECKLYGAVPLMR